MAIRNWADAIASIESAGSGDYAAVGPLTKKGNRAYGRYQVMDFNVGPWTEKHLGKRLTPQEFLSNPKAQDAVFEGEFGGYVDRYGSPQEAASVWFTGKPMAEGAGRTDVLGTSGSGYVSKFNRALGQGGTSMQPTVSTQGAMPSQPEEKQPFYKNPNFWDTLAMGFAGMSLNPNQAIIQSSANRIKGRQEQAASSKSRNRTAEWLKSQGRDDLAQAVLSGAIDGKTAAGIAYQQPKEEFRQVSGADLGMAGADAAKMFNVAPDGKITAIGGSGTTVNVGGEGGVTQEAAKVITKRADILSQQGQNARRSVGMLNALERELQSSPQGIGGAFVNLAGNLGLEFDGTSAAQAAQAIISRMVPEQRAPGSGPMSDSDLELFKQSLPRLINTPEGNRKIIETLRGVLEYDMQMGAISDDLLLGKLTPEDAISKYQSLQNPLSWVQSEATMPTDDERRKALELLTGE